MNKNLKDDYDSIMADGGFTIQNEPAPLNVGLNVPSFFGGRGQTIASVRIQVEITVIRIKQFKAMNHIPLALHGSVNHIWIASCMMCNFLSSSIKENSAI